MQALSESDNNNPRDSSRGLFVLKKIACFTVFLGSFLLFGVQPMLGRTLLPSFGGTAAVWTVCLGAYQLLLLAGYFYAHLLSRKKFQVQIVIHVSMLALATVWASTFAWTRFGIKAAIGNSILPSVEVLLCVTVFVGLPYVMLSAGSTLIQAWLAQSTHNTHNEEPHGLYKLYAISNLGSFTGLLFYPLVLEPYVSLTVQWWSFVTLFFVYAIMIISIAVKLGNAAKKSIFAADLHANTHCETRRSILWFLLPALSSFALVATTNRLTLETTPMPLFWVLLLSAFLLSYVIGFSQKTEKMVKTLLFLALLACIGAGAAQRLNAATSFEWILLSGVAFLFFGGIFLHGWLHASRPPVNRLTTFYVCIAAGGAFGGIMAAIFPPMIFKTVCEFPLAILLMAFAGTLFIQGANLERKIQRCGYFLVILSILCGTVGRSIKSTDGTVLLRERNFYGTLLVTRKTFTSRLGSQQVVHYLKHGNTTHGVQFRETGLSQMPTAYFGEHAGGFPIISHYKRKSHQPLRVAVVGLGIGILANYGEKGDLFRFYDINPQVIGVATNNDLFSYISDCRAKVEIVEGDARKRLEEERARGDDRFDVLVIDIFSGDSIAPHMISAEAFDLYKDRLQEDGVFAIHISNWHIDLFPVCKAVAKRWNMKVVGVVARADESKGQILSFWSFFTNNQLPSPDEKCRLVDFERVKDVELMTDEKGSLLNLIRFLEPPPTLNPHTTHVPGNRPTT